jgi:hypothetical protein
MLLHDPFVGLKHCNARATRENTEMQGISQSACEARFGFLNAARRWAKTTSPVLTRQAFAIGDSWNESRGS